MTAKTEEMRSYTSGSTWTLVTAMRIPPPMIRNEAPWNRMPPLRLASIEIEGTVRAVKLSETVPSGATRITSTSKITLNFLDRAILMNILRAAREAMLALLSNRELMSIQLTHAHGGMSDDEFDKLVDTHLDSVPPFDESKTVMIATCLAGLVPERFDAELVSVAARCSIEQASHAISEATKDLDKILPVGEI